MASRQDHLAIAALTVEINGEGALRVLPAGTFRARDGRPHDVPSWRLDANVAQRVIAAMSARNDALVIDYEHQTLYTEKNGQKAPAAGWMKSAMQWRADGLYAEVEWTAAAKAEIAAKEYRYFSPVFTYDKKTGEVAHVLMGALTNNPGLDGLTDLTARAAARFNYDQPHEDNAMTKEQLALLGLAEGATAEQITTALTALKSSADKATTTETELAALKAQAPDPAKFVPVDVVKALQVEVTALKSQNTEREVDDLVTAAMTAGKILPAMEPWARDLGKKDVAQLKAFIAAAQPIAALTGTQTGGKGPGGATGEALDVAKLKADWAATAALRDEFVSADDYAAYKKAEAEGRARSFSK